MTVPPLARDIWRIEMMTPERRRVSQFFLGGEMIQVSFPTDTMSHRDFHDTILRNGRIPVEIVRHVLSGEPPAEAFAPAWRFADGF